MNENIKEVKDMNKTQQGGETIENIVIRRIRISSYDFLEIAIPSSLEIPSSSNEDDEDEDLIIPVPENIISCLLPKLNNDDYYYYYEDNSDYYVFLIPIDKVKEMED